MTANDAATMAVMVPAAALLVVALGVSLVDRMRRHRPDIRSREGGCRRT